jgi:hypothetical protein
MRSNIPSGLLIVRMLADGKIKVKLIQRMKV